MAKTVKDFIAQSVIPKDMGDIFKDYYLTYATYIILQRAIPDIRDGMKPINRRILYSMYNSNYTSNLSYKKSARIVGEVMGKFHPHGDCLRGNTILHSIDGKRYTLKELVDNNVRELKVLSYDQENNKFVEALAHSFRIGQYANEIYRINFYDNSYIESTSNHPFYLYNKGWVKTEDLKSLDVLFGYKYKKTRSKINDETFRIEVIKGIEQILKFIFNERNNENNKFISKELDWNLYNLGRLEYMYNNETVIYPDQNIISEVLKTDKFEDVLKVISSETELKIIRSIDKISTQNEPMYDFTVDKYENALCYLQNTNSELSNSSMLLAHNSSIYGAAVLMAQDFNNNNTTIDGHGAFGSIDGDAPAAMRYTEMRLTKFSEDVLMGDFKNNIVDMKPNYSGDELEPTVLPVKIPYLLLNGIEGIAIAYATSIPPHNLGEIVDGLVAYVNNRGLTSTELMKYIPAPDYPTKGIIEGVSNLSGLYSSGTGGHILKGRMTCEQNKKGQFVFTITEVPYGVKPEDIISQIRTLNELEAFKVDSVVNGNDKTKKVNIIITFNKSEDNQSRLEGILYTRTYLSIRKSYNILVLKDGKPAKVSILQILRDFVKFREECHFKKNQSELNKNLKRMHILEGLFKIHPALDVVIKIIRNSGSVTEAQKSLMKEFKLSEEQTDYILRMPLMRLTKLEMDSAKNEHKNLEDRNKVLQQLMSNNGCNKYVDKIMTDEWLDIKKKYAKPRMTEIKSDVTHYDTTKLIKAQPCTIILTKNGYIKRLELIKDEMVQSRGGKGRNIPGLDLDDEVKEIIECETTTQLTLVTSSGKVFNKYAFDIPESKGVGRKIENIFELSKKDKPVLFTAFNDNIKRVALILKNGDIKISNLSDLRGGIKITPEGKSSRNKKGTKLMKMNPGDELVAAVGLTMKGNDDSVIIASEQGKALRMNIKDIRVSSTNAGGIKGMTLEGDDSVISACGTNSDYLTVISKSGFVKRIETSDIRSISRGGKGVKIGNSSDDSGILYIGDKSEGLLTITTSSNRMLTFDLETIRATGKTSKGVKVCNLNNGEYLTNVN